MSVEHSEAFEAAVCAVKAGKRAFGVHETEQFSGYERLLLCSQIRRQVILERYGFEPPFERVAQIRRIK